MGAIEDLYQVQPFNAGNAYANTANYRGVKSDLNNIADRLQSLIGNLGIRGLTADAIDESITALVEQIRERADNVNQLSDARNTATRGGDTAGERAATIQPQHQQALTMMASADPATVTRGEMLYMRLEQEASTALSALATQTNQAIGELPTVFPASSPVSQGGGGGYNNQRGAAAGNSAPHSTITPAGTHAGANVSSATNWMPTQADPAQPMNAGSRASFSPQVATAQPTANVSYEPSVGSVTPTATANTGFTANPGAVGEGVATPINNATPVANPPAVATAADGFAASNVPFEASQNTAFGVAKAAAGAAALPAMAKAVSRAASAIPRGGATARANGTGAARGATPRGAAPARATGRSGAATRASATPKGSLTPRPGQGAATRAATPARGTGAAGKGATARGTAGTRGASGTARPATSASRGATGMGRPAAAGRAGTTGKAATPKSGTGRATTGRGGVTAPRAAGGQGAGKSTGKNAGRGIMGRPVTGRGKKDKREENSIESYAATELVDESTVTFIEAGQRDAELD